MTTNTINAADRLANEIDMLPVVRSVERYVNPPLDERERWPHGTVTFVIRTQDDRKLRIVMSNELIEDSRAAFDCVWRALSAPPRI